MRRLIAVDPKNLCSQPRQMPGCGAAYSTQTDDDHFVCWHGSCRGFFGVLSRPVATEAVACLQRSAILSIRPLPPLDTSDEWGPQSQCGPMKKSRFGDWR